MHWQQSLRTCYSPPLVALTYTKLSRMLHRGLARFWASTRVHRQMKSGRPTKSFAFSAAPPSVVGPWLTGCGALPGHNTGYSHGVSASRSGAPAFAHACLEAAGCELTARLRIRFHPDKVSPEEAEQAAIKFRAVQDAFKVRGTPNRSNVPSCIGVTTQWLRAAGGWR